MKDNESICTIWANGTLLASVNNNALTNYASATADTAVFSALRLLGAQGPAYSAFTGNSQDVRVSDTARYPFMPVEQTFTTTNSARTGVSVSSASNTKLLAFTTTTTTTDATSTHTITAQDGSYRC